MLLNYITSRIAVGALLLAFSMASPAADEPTDDPSPSAGQLMELVEAALPQELITEDNSKLVAQMLQPKLGTPLSRSFNSTAVIKQLFGRGGASLSPECRKLFTPSGDMATDECEATKGDRNGAGAFRELRFSKHMTLGNIGYFVRQADTSVDPAKILPIKMTDEQAYAAALAFMTETLGVPAEEIPPIPADVKVWPVRTIALGFANAEGKGAAATPISIPVEKMVLLPRGLFVQAHSALPWAPGPGRAYVVMDDEGVKEAAVQSWQEARPHPQATAEMAKKRSELVVEIAEDLAAGMDGQGLQGPVKAINVRLVLSAPTSDANGVALLLPAIQTAVMPVPRDPTEDEQQFISRSQTTTAGMIREYLLVHMNPEAAAGADEIIKVKEPARLTQRH